MVDDVLRMRATVVSDQALAELRKIGREIGIVGQRGAPGIKTINTEFARLGQTVRGVGRELTSAIPALGGMGLGAAGVGLAIGQLVRTMGDAAKRVVELKYASKELGMSERDLRAWQSTAEKAGVSAQSMMQGLEAFKKTTDGLKYNIGGARDELYAMGAGPIVQRMQAAATQADKLKVAFNFKDELMKSDPTGFKARMFFDQMGLGADKARLSLEEYVQAQGKLRERTKEEIDAAEKYAKALVDLGDKWEDLKVKTGVSIFPTLTNTLKELEGIVTWLNKIDDFTTRDPLGAFSTYLQKEKGTNLPPEQQRGPRTPAESLAMGYSPISFGGGTGGGLSDGSRMVKDGVFAALVEFQSYATGAAGGGGGFTNASFGGSAGAAAGGGVGRAPGAAGFGGGGYSNLTGQDAGGGAPGSGGGGGGAQPGGSGTGTSGAPGQTSQTGDMPGSVPKDVMQEARNMLQRGGSSGQVQQFMASKGYPRSGAWCGQFAASVVKSAGGAPPKGAAVASNWLNWGTRVAPGDVQEGDVMVRKSSRYGGMAVPGQPGSHVAFAGGAIKDGKVQMVGGNQGGVREGVNASRYEFRRAGPSGAGGSAADRKTVKGSVFGSTDGFSDSSEPRGRKTASGVSNERPGIALPGRSGLGKMHAVTTPDGRTFMLPQTDIGPHPRTGRGIDITSSAAAQMGYSRKTFPTDGNFSYRRMDEQIAGGTSVNGKVNVTVNSNGTAAKTSASAEGGLWQQTTIQNYKQMQPTSAPVGNIAQGP